MAYSYQLIQIGDKFSLRRPSFWGGWKYLGKIKAKDGYHWWYDFIAKFKDAHLMDREEADKKFDIFTNPLQIEEEGITIIKESKMGS